MKSRTRGKCLGVWLAMAVLAAAALGCRTRVLQAPPPVVTPAAFSDSGSAALPDHWWEGLDDARLAGLIEEALAGNFTLRAAWRRLAQAEAVARRAGASLLPSADVSVSDGYSWRHQAVVGPDGSARFTTTESKSRSLGLAASYEVDLWGQIRSEQTAARLDALASRDNLQAAAVTLSAEVASTWYELQELQGQIALLDQQIQTTSATLNLIQGRFARGQASATDVLQQQQLLESRRGERERTLASLGVLEHTLSILLGRTPGAEDFQLDGTLIEPGPLPATGLPADVVERRPDVRAAYRAVQAADQRVATAITDQYPRLTLSAGLSTSAEQWRDLFDNWLATLAANVAEPLVDGGRRKAEVERTQAAMAERVDQWGDTVLQALGEVEDALVRERHQRLLIASLDEQLRLARQVLSRTLQEFLQGGAQYLRVLDAQQSVQGLERSLLSARLDLISNRIALYRALAGGWPMQPAPGLWLPGMAERSNAEAQNSKTEPSAKAGSDFEIRTSNFVIPAADGQGAPS